MRGMLWLVLSACAVPPLALNDGSTKDEDEDTDTRRNGGNGGSGGSSGNGGGVTPDDTFKIADSGDSGTNPPTRPPGGGGGGSSSGGPLPPGGTGGGPTGTGTGGFIPDSVFFLGVVAVDGSGAVSPYTISGVTIESFLSFSFYDVANTECSVFFDLPRGAPPTPVRTWASGQGYALGIELLFDPSKYQGPFDNSGALCEFDSGWLGGISFEDFLIELFSDAAGTPGAYRLAFGGQVSPEAKTEFIDVVAGNNGFPPATDWTGGVMQTPFQFGTSTGSTDLIDAATMQFEIPATMVLPASPTLGNPSGLAPGKAVPRGLYQVFPIYGLVFN